MVTGMLSQVKMVSETSSILMVFPRFVAHASCHEIGGAGIAASGHERHEGDVGAQKSEDRQDDPDIGAHGNPPACSVPRSSHRTRDGNVNRVTNRQIFCGWDQCWVRLGGSWGNRPGHAFRASATAFCRSGRSTAPGIMSLPMIKAGVPWIPS